ncbi:hypothetical protein HDV00_008293 [Rhizophlyctis rosea]|nr:hypothetical protein HDV00_008293 [Rhizophlyctis rosea]
MVALSAMVRKGWFVTCLILGATVVDGKPTLHTPNLFDLHGANCTAPLRQNVPCPVVCVTSVDQCPQLVRPDACPSGQFYCQDGQCHAGDSLVSACEDATPKCSCPFGFLSTNLLDRQFPKQALFPCKEGFATDVFGFDDDPADGDQPLLNRCAQQLNVQANFTTGTDPFLKECLPRAVRAFSFGDDEFVAFYGIFGAEVFLLIVYWIYKRVWESFHRDTHQFEPRPLNMTRLSMDPEMELQDIQNLPQEPPLRFTGYRPDLFGSFVGISIFLSSLTYLCLMGIIIGDYYGMFAGWHYRDEQMIFVNHDNLSKVFVLMWHILTLWLLAVKVMASGSSPYFRIKCGLEQASFVMIEKRREPPVYISGMGKLVELVRKVETWFRKVTKTDVSSETVTVNKTSTGRRYVEHECVRYVFDDQTRNFEPTKFNVGPKYTDLLRQADGLSTAEAYRREELVGANEILFPADTFATMTVKEFSGIFYVYQLMSLLIWYYYAYYYMGIVLTIVIISAGFSKVSVGLRSQRKVLEMAAFEGSCRILRDGGWTTVSTKDVVPGDVIEVQTSEHVLPVDCVLVDGGAVADESSLTGEALPVAKFAIKNENVTYSPDHARVHSLFAGCHILQVQPSDKQPVKAIVTSTGANTSKGKLVRDILYPTPVSFVFTEHLKLVFLLLMVWGVIMLGLSVLMVGSSSIDSWFYGMFTISQILSPLLPAVLVIGQSVAADRLRKLGILCIDLQRITLAGKVKVFCFDKTGTLTKEGLNFFGAQSTTLTPTLTATPKFKDVQSHYSAFDDSIQKGMMACHSVTMVGDTPVGNFVDVEMFRATGASLGEGNGTVIPAGSGAAPVHIVKRFEFVHAHAYMSVVIKDGRTEAVSVFLKGAYEKIKDLVDPSSIPADFDNITRAHASRGCYVLALARRDLPEGVSAQDAARWERKELESGAKLVGLIMFRNELKEDTARALDELRDGGCRVVMITGDNANTGVHIGKASGMLRKDWQGRDPIVILGDVATEKGVIWRNVDDNSVVSHSVLENLLDLSHRGDRPVELAVTGKAFNILLADGWMRRHLLDTRIFARMLPEDKVRCVRLHMEHAVTAMCGDGGNDAGALKASHAGIALSEAESSVVSHFSSRNRSVFSCVELLKEGRCSLDVSFASYKYLLMYGEVLAFVGLVQYYFMVNLSQPMWILIDGSTVPLSWALTMARPALRLSPLRPTARLLGAETIISVVGQIIINLIFVIVLVVVLFQQEFFRCHEFDGNKAEPARWWELADNYEGETTGILAVFQIFHAAACFNVGNKFRRGFFRNYVFVLTYSALFVILSYILLAPPNALGCLFHVNCGTSEALAGANYGVPVNAPSEYFSSQGHNVMPSGFRWVVWGICVLNLVCLMVFEGVGVLGIGRRWAARRWPLKKEVFRS